MIRKAALILSVCVIVIYLLLFSACDQSNSTQEPEQEYYPEGPEFTAYLSGTLDPSFEGFFQSMETTNREVSYHFNSSSGDGQLLLRVPEAFSRDLAFEEGSSYTLYYQVMHGWPSVYGLVVLHENEVVFIGITDIFIDYKINPQETLYPEFDQLFRVEQTAVLDNHFITSRQCYDRITNTEVTFTHNEDSLSLHQGQSGQLGDYQVKLLIARKVDYAEGCYDTGLTGISYIITKSG